MASVNEYEETLRKHGIQGMRSVLDVTQSLERQYEKSLKPKTPEALMNDTAFQQTVSSASEDIPSLMLAVHRYMNKDFYCTVNELQTTLKDVNHSLKERLDNIVYVPTTRDIWKGKYNLHGDYDKLMGEMEDLTFLADQLLKSKRRAEIQLGEISDLSKRLALLMEFGLTQEEAMKEIEEADERQRERERQLAEEERKRKEKEAKEEEERRKREAAAEEARQKREEEERLKREEEERKKQKLLEERQRKEEAARKKREQEEEEERKKQAELEEQRRKKNEENEKKRQEKLKKKAEEEARKEELRRKKEEEDEKKRKQLEEEEEIKRKQKEEEEEAKRAAAEEKRKVLQAQKEEKERIKREKEAERLRLEEERIAKEKMTEEENERKRIKEAEEEEENRLRKEEEEKERLKREAEEKEKRLEEEERERQRIQQEKDENEKQRVRDEQLKKEEEEKERQRQEELLKEQEAQREKEEQERKQREEEEKLAKEEKERKKKEEDEARKKKLQEERDEEERILKAERKRKVEAARRRLDEEYKERDRLEREERERKKRRIEEKRLERERLIEEEKEKKRLQEEEDENERIREAARKEEEKIRLEQEAEEERIRQEQEEEERKARQLEEEEKERQRLEEEALQRAEEEKERLEAEEKENERLAEEQKRREEEKERLEKEEEERQKRESPDKFPLFMYEFDEGEASEYDYGDGLICAIRAPEIDDLKKEDFVVRGVNRSSGYQLDEINFEKLVSNRITISPSVREVMNFEYPIYLSLPYSCAKQSDRELCLRFLSVSDDLDHQSDLDRQSDRATPDKQTDTEGEIDKQTDAEGETSKPTDQDGVTDNETEAEGETSNIQEVDENTPSDTIKNTASDTSKNTNPEEMMTQGSRERNKEIIAINKQPWRDVTAKEIAIQEMGSLRFLQTALSDLSEGGVQAVIVNRLMKDVRQIKPDESFKHSSSVDERNFISGKKGTFNANCTLTIQTILIDSSMLSGAKDLYEMEHLHGASSILQTVITEQPKKFVTVSLANPVNVLKQRQIGSSVTKSDGRHGKTFNASGQADESEERVETSLLVKMDNGNWKHRNDITLRVNNDSTVFQTTEIFPRMVLLNTSGHLESSGLCKMVSNIEKSLTEVTAVLVLRQLVSNPTSLYVECCKIDNLEAVLMKLKNKNYTEGPAVSQPFCLREGDVLQVSFRDNLDFEDRTPRRMTFNSNLSSASFFSYIRHNDAFSQNGLDYFRGFAVLSLVNRPYIAPPKWSTKSSSKQQSSVAPGFVTELKVTIPKFERELTRVRRTIVRVPQEGALTEAYFKQLAFKLGDEWRTLVSRLGHDSASIQRIRQNHKGPYNDDTEEVTPPAIEQMIIEWFKTCEQAENKVEILMVALQESGRKDLSDELKKTDDDLRETQRREHIDNLVVNCSKAYIESKAALKGWRSVAKALGLNSEDMAAMAGPDNPLPDDISYEQVHQMFTRWREINKDVIDKDDLIKVLRRLKLYEAAENVAQIR